MLIEIGNIEFNKRIKKTLNPKFTNQELTNIIKVPNLTA